jgi:hypothetical protein
MADASDRSNTPMVVVVVALVGLFSTLAASAVSAFTAVYVADRSFYNQRTAALTDQRRVVYADFLQALVTACIVGKTGDEAKLDKAISDFANEEARVTLIGSAAVGSAAQDLLTSVIFQTGKENPCNDNDILIASRQKFVDSAKVDLE